jgi:choline-glycine betaine transporter
MGIFDGNTIFGWLEAHGVVPGRVSIFVWISAMLLFSFTALIATGAWGTVRLGVPQRAPFQPGSLRAMKPMSPYVPM